MARQGSRVFLITPFGRTGVDGLNAVDVMDRMAVDS